MFNNFFNWDFDYITTELLPPKLRKKKYKAFIQSIGRSFSNVHNALTQFRSTSEYEILFSSERLQFEHYLNDKFDRIGRSIRLINAPFLGHIYVYKHVENRPIRMYKHSENQTNPRMYKLQEYEISIHFIIEIPTGLLSDLEEKALRSYVDHRKLPNKNYTIQHI